MAGRRFGQDRYKPPGEWVQTTMAEDVVGIPHHKRDALAFVHAVDLASRKGLAYGVMVVPEPSNRVDCHAIKVLGFADRRSLFGKVKRDIWHVGYLDAGVAAELHNDLISAGHPISAELYSVYLGADGDFVDITIIVLAPPGYSHSARRRSPRLSQ